MTQQQQQHGYTLSITRKKTSSANHLMWAGEAPKLPRTGWQRILESQNQKLKISNTKFLAISQRWGSLQTAIEQNQNSSKLLKAALFWMHRWIEKIMIAISGGFRFTVRSTILLVDESVQEGEKGTQRRKQANSLSPVDWCQPPLAEMPPRR